MRRLKHLLALLTVCTVFMLPAAALCEGDPLLSVDDLMQLEDSYAAFLDDLEALIVERGLLSEGERAAWRDAQMGDFLQNGGYGSILANYTPGVLSYARAEETTISLDCRLAGGQTLRLLTMRRYTPRDSSLSGLMLTMEVTSASGLPQDVTYALSATSGVFLKWDPIAGAYMSVGVSAESEGETVVWSDQTPSAGAKNPVITLQLFDAETELPLPGAQLMLAVEGDGYRVMDGALSAMAHAGE